MDKIYQECLRLLQCGQDAVLATIVEAKGSAPRTAGTKMIVRQDGTIMGSIGGGRLEHEVVAVAQNSFDNRQSVIYAFELTGDDVAEMDMICGGRGEVWLQFLSAVDPNNLLVCMAIADVLSHKKPGWLITEISTQESLTVRQFALVDEDRSITGRVLVNATLLEEWINHAGKMPTHIEIYNGHRFLIEPIRSKRTVFIFGAGHVSRQLVPLCEMVDFRTVVLDDREEYACRPRFPVASQIQVLESFENWERIAINEDSFIVILTRGHMHDKTVLAEALRTPAAYVGMIGSRRKREIIFQALREEGFSQQDLDRVHSPIGLDIAAETPAELAVSIVGELIQVRAAQK